MALLAALLLAAQPVAGQTIRFGPGVAAPTAFNSVSGRYEEGSSFDPYICAEQPCGELLHNVFDGLVSVSDAGKISPALAIAWDRLDEVRFRLSLRRGVKFHNGEVLDAEAVRFSLMRASQAYGATAWFPEIARVDIVDPYVVDVVLKAPDSLFLYRARAPRSGAAAEIFPTGRPGAVRRTAGWHGCVPLRSLGSDPARGAAGGKSGLLAAGLPQGLAGGLQVRRFGEGARGPGHAAASI